MAAFGLLGLAACERGPSEAELAAQPLCAWGQLEHLQLRMVPESVGLEPHVRDADLRFLKDRLASEEAQVESESPLKALARGLVETIAVMGRAITEANAKHARCEFELIELTENSASLRVTRSVPDITPADPKVRSAEMAKLTTHEERVEALSGLMVNASERESETYEVTMIKQGGAWVIDYGLPEAEVAKLEAELAGLQAKAAAFAAQQALLDRVSVTEASVVEERTGRLVESALTLGLENGLEAPMTSGSFVATVMNGEEEVGSREFDVTPPEPLAPGAGGKWTLTGNAFRALGQLAKPVEGAAVVVEPIEVVGADGQPLASVREQVHVEGEVSRVGNELEAVREAYLKR